MRFHARILVAAITVMFFTNAKAQQACTPIKTAIYYGNGVGRGVPTEYDARQGLKKLQHLVREDSSEEEYETYNFKISFNQSAGRISDITEAAQQTFGNEWPSILVSLLLRNKRFLSMLPPKIVQSFNDFLNSEAIRQMVAPDLANTNLARHISSYNTDIEEGMNIVLVSHSQGNVFGNLAYLGLPTDKQQYFTMVPVASPESTSRRSIVNEHVRFRDDLVILGVEVGRRAVGLPLPMPANDEDDIDADWTGHGFVEAYLTDSSSRARIISATTESIRLLPVPEPTNKQGEITATLTWGTNPDVDLHAFEPTGAHVYYRNLVATGELDVDDIDGEGPEHYAIQCSKLLESTNGIGTYRIGVNYFSGSSPENAKVTIKTPGDERTFTVPLAEARDVKGDPSPEPVADIVVSRHPISERLQIKIVPK